MTIQERNDYLNEHSWQMRERQHVFNMESFKTGTKYDNYGQILQLAGISKDERRNKSQYYRDRLDYFLNTQKQKDGQIKVTKVKGELVENPFSWEQRSFMSAGYMLDMMIIYILDNHINRYWSKDKWCEVLGLIVAKKDDYDFTNYDHPNIFFDTAYDCMQQMAHTRLYNTLVSLESRGVIKRKTIIVCKDKQTNRLRPFNQKEREIYEETIRRTLHRRKNFDIESVNIYPEVYPKFIKALREYDEFKNLYFRYVVQPEYLYPQEHSYMRPFEFYMYQRRLQKAFKPKVLKTAQSKKQELIETVARHYRFVQEFPEGCPQDVIEELTDARTLSTIEYWTKRYSHYRTDVRDVVDFIFKGGQNHWNLTPNLTPLVGS